MLNMLACSKAGSSADKPVAPDAEMVESSVGKPASSHDASAAADSSVVQPAANVGDEIVLAFYNITWNEQSSLVLTREITKRH